MEQIRSGSLAVGFIFVSILRLKLASFLSPSPGPSLTWQTAQKTNKKRTKKNPQTDGGARQGQRIRSAQNKQTIAPPPTPPPPYLHSDCVWLRGRCLLSCPEQSRHLPVTLRRQTDKERETGTLPLSQLTSFILFCVDLFFLY